MFPLKKLKDLLIISAISGLVGNIPKLAAAAIARKAKSLELDGPEKAAAMVVAPQSVSTPVAKVVGYIGDEVIAGAGGLIITAALYLTGPELAPLKGAILGEGIWTMLYGALTSMGASKIKTVSPKTALSEAIGHTVYGMVAATVAVAIADPSVFKRRI